MLFKIVFFLKTIGLVGKIELWADNSKPIWLCNQDINKSNRNTEKNTKMLLQ